MIPTSDLLRDRQIAEELADQELLTRGEGLVATQGGVVIVGADDLGWSFVPESEMQARASELLTQLRAGTVAAPSPPGVVETITGTLKSAAVAVADLPRRIGETVGEVGAGLAGAARWATLGLAALAVLAVVVVVRR